MPITFFRLAIVALEFWFGLIFAIGGRSALLACFTLIISLLAAQVIYHSFWEQEGLMEPPDSSLI